MKNEALVFEFMVHLIELMLVLGIALTVLWTKKLKRKKQNKEKVSEGPVSSSGKDI